MDKKYPLISAGSSKPCITDIRLDRTPTDDEIDVLWDRVRDCLQETPTGSARSAPPDLQTTPNDRQPTAPNQHNNNSSLPPKQPIKKVHSLYNLVLNQFHSFNPWNFKLI